jgi:type III restriction enzyme
MAVGFTLDNVMADGSRSNYIPDFIMNLTNGEIWIVETMRREDENDPGKWERIQQHCAGASKLDAGRPYRALPVREEEWDTYSPKHNYTRRRLSE